MTSPPLDKRLFQRAWSLVIAPPGKGKLARQYSSAPEKGLPLRMSFSVQRSLDQKSNKASIVLYNLTQQTMQWIERGFSVFLDVGYGPNVPSPIQRIFLGQVVERSTTQQGPDTATELVCGDTEFLLQQAHVSVSFYNADVATVLNKIVQDLGRVTLAGEGVMQGSFMSNIRNPRLGRYADAGPASLVLTRLLKNRGFDWSFQSGKLLISHTKGGVLTPSTQIDTSSGLIERPTLSKRGVKFRSLIQPEIVPGLVATLKSESIECNGTFRVCEANYQGDTHGGDWFVDVYGETFTDANAHYEPPKSETGDANQAAVPTEADDPEMDEDMVDQ